LSTPDPEHETLLSVGIKLINYVFIFLFFFNKHEFGPAETTLKLLKQSNKGSYMKCWEQKYIQEYHRSGKLITEQQTCEYNPLFAIAQERNKGIESVIPGTA